LGAAYVLTGRVPDGQRLLEEAQQRGASSGIVSEGTLRAIWLAESYLLVALGLGPSGACGRGGFTLFCRSEGRLQVRDLCVTIVRHRPHPGPTALLRDGVRIARPLNPAL